jgi:hypothetical protein
LVKQAPARYDAGTPAHRRAAGVGFWGFLNQGWNLPYLVLLGLVAVFLVLQLFGLLGGGDADVDLHAEADLDADLVHGAHAEGGGVLGFFGVGRAPLMVVWVTFCLFAGFTGIAFNRWVYERWEGQYPDWAFPVSGVFSCVAGLVAMRLFSGLAARLIDMGGRGSTKKHELAGRRGVVASAQLDARFGEVRVQDAQGNELLIHARLDAGDAAALKRGDRVVLVDYDAERGLFRASALSGRDE